MSQYPRDTYLWDVPFTVHVALALGNWWAHGKIHTKQKIKTEIK